MGIGLGSRDKGKGAADDEKRQLEKWMKNEDSRFGVLVEAFFFEVTSLSDLLLVHGVLAAPVPFDNAHQDEEHEDEGNGADQADQPVRFRQMIDRLR